MLSKDILKLFGLDLSKKEIQMEYITYALLPNPKIAF